MPHTPPHLADPQPTTVTDATFDPYLKAVASGFQEAYHQEWRDLARALMDNDRQYGFTVDDRWVATYGAFSRQISVPGGTAVPVAAVTVVTVQPPYRRRGLLTAMMQRGLDDFAERGEPLAALWASESGIYGRYGFAPSASRLMLSGKRAKLRFLDGAPTSGSVDEVDRTTYLRIGGELWPQVCASRPGALNRESSEWDAAVFDPEFSRGGANELRYIAHFNDNGTPEGFAAYCFKEDFDGNDPAGEVRVLEAHASTPTAYAGLWRYLLDIDLSDRFRYRNAPVDEPLRHLLSNARALTTEVTDNIYLRVIDVAKALRLRQYAAPIDTVIEVVDSQLPANNGRYRVLASPFTEATASRTDDAPDISLSVLELGAIYLGGVPLTTLAYAGRVTEHTEGAVRDATEAFGWPVAPHCADHF